MKTASAFLKAYLSSANSFRIADLYTFTLVDGTVLRYATADGDVRVPGNLSPTTENFGSASWTNTRTTDAVNAVTGPDGLLSGDSLIEDSSVTLTHYIEHAYQTIPAAVAPFCGSVYAKAGARSWILVQMIESLGGLTSSCFFDLANGALGTASQTGNWIGTKASIVAVSNQPGWYRCQVVSNKINAAVGLLLRIYLATGNNNQTYTGNGVSNAYLWGAALDSAPGANGTAYIPNAATTPLLARSFDASGIIIRRGSIKSVVGVVVDTLQLTVTATPAQLIGSTPWLQALGNGALDGATVLVERMIMPAVGDYSLGTYVMFSGRVSEINFGRYEAQISVHSDLELLNVQMPRSVYQPGCLNTLFDSSCTLVKSSFGVSGTIAAGTDATRLYTNLSQAVGWFASGTVTFTSGALSGQSMGVKDYATVGRLTLYSPLTTIPSVGDTFTAYPGCPKTQAACSNNAAGKPAFNNLSHFRGFPYIPAPETVT